MTAFRPCIDLHNGKVKQIVGSSLSNSQSELKENFVSEHGAEWYAELYKKDKLKGGHIIMLGTGNESAAINALQTYPQGMQIGGGITSSNYNKFLDLGASAIIVTSYIFPDGSLSLKRLKEFPKEKLVIDLSCKDMCVAINRWQTITDFKITKDNLEMLAEYCSEFLIHATAVEGKKAGMDLELIEFLGAHSPIPTTYAGGANSLTDIETVNQLSNGKVDLTVGSALDIFGGNLPYKEFVNYNSYKV
jgi:phosphoribosylformimino-5-aminoimidazole carboxamide ribotide isomerase